MATDRRQVAHWAEQYLAGNLSFNRFIELVPEQSQDSLIAELVDLIEHEPKRGGILGVTPREHDEHLRRVRDIIAALRTA